MDYYANDKAKYPFDFIYATPSQFFTSLERNNNQISFPYKYDDFFPYSDYPKTYWAGFFTSRSCLKYAIKEMGIKFRIYSNLLAVSALNQIKIPDELTKGVKDLGKTVAAMQHHDSITGTSTERVSNYMYDQVVRSLSEAEKVLLLKGFFRKYLLSIIFF